VHLAAKHHRSSAMKEFLVHQPMTLKSMVDLINFKNKRGKAVLHLAAANADAKLLDLLLPIEGVDVNVMTKRKQTPLHLAISNNNEAGVLRLLEKKPRTDIQDKYGNTALHLACFHGLQNCVLALGRVCGPEVVKLVNQEGKTALHLALEQNFPDIADILTRNGADVTIEYEFYSKRNQRLT
jgi:ankyrin repeat protein